VGICSKDDIKKPTAEVIKRLLEESEQGIKKHRQNRALQAPFTRL
jgi:hypothetical protein